jgi:hypothetical protein
VNEIPKGDVCRKQDDRDENNDGRVDELLVFLKPANFGIGFPRPGCFTKLGFDLADEFEDFLEHFEMWGKSGRTDRN